MDTILIPTPIAKLMEWKRLLLAMHGQAHQHVRRGQSKTDMLFTLENMYVEMNALIQQNYHPGGAWEGVPASTLNHLREEAGYQGAGEDMRE